MAILTVLIVGVILLVVGRILVHFIGWPRSLADGAKWSALLFASSILATAIPQLTAAVTSRLGELPAVEAGEFIACLVIVGLGILGFVAWRKGEDAVRAEPRLQFRRRALPPPPARNPGERQFNLLDNEGDDE